MKIKLWLTILVILVLTSCVNSKVKEPIKSEAPVASSTSEPKVDLEIVKKAYSYLTVANIEHCADGSEIITFDYSALDNKKTTFYVRYIPVKENGKYNFFRQTSIASDLSFENAMNKEIPVVMDNSDNYRFSIQYDFTGTGDYAKIYNTSIKFLNEEDKKFNEIYSKVRTEDRESHRATYEFSSDFNELELEEQIEFLKACIYNGNTNLLVNLESLIEEEYENEKISLANYKNGTGLIDKENTYISKVFYEEKLEEYPKKELVKDIVSNIQLGNPIYGEGVVQVARNYDNAKIYDIPNIKDFVSEYDRDKLDFSEYKHLYKYDLDNDGLDEILMYSVVGSGRFVYWYVLHLNSSGEITHLNNGHGNARIGLTLYKKGTDYFFNTDDRNSVYVIGQDNKTYEANIYNNYSFSTSIFSDTYNGFDKDAFYETSKYIENYEELRINSVGQTIDPDEDVLKMFEMGESYSNCIFGKVDINNDGVEDYTLVTTFDDYRFGYYYDFEFVDGRTRELIKFDNFSRQYGGRAMAIAYVYEADDKNYLVNMFEVNGNYIFKVFDIKGTELVEVEDLLVSSINDIMVQINIFDYKDELIYSGV